MTARVTLQPAYVLHSRVYRDTSRLVDLLTPDYGRVSVIARGVRSPRSMLRGLLIPFTPLLVSWTGRTELMTLTKAEPGGPPYRLQGRRLICCVYLNELAVRLLHRYDPHPRLYEAYRDALTALNACDPVLEPALRRFEFLLLRELGYGIQLDRDTQGRVVEPQAYYRYRVGQGLERMEGLGISSDACRGASLIEIAQDRLEDPETQRDAKRLTHIGLHSLLGDRPIRSRELWF